MDEILNKYNTFKNCLKKFNREDLLYAIWAYEKKITYAGDWHQITDVQFPSPLRDHKTWLHGWSLEQLATEAILHCSLPFGRKNPQILRDFAYIYNRQKDFASNLDQHFLQKEKELQTKAILKFMTRLAYQQTPWQADLASHQFFFRYYSIFSNPDVDKIIVDNLGFSYLHLYLFAFVAWSTFSKKFHVDKLPDLNDIAEMGYNKEIMGKIWEMFVGDIEDVKYKIDDLHRIDETYGYAFNPLRSKPILALTKKSGKTTFLSPLSELIVWRGTRSLYYDLSGYDSFGIAWGKAFAKYLEKIVHKLIPKSIACCDKEYYVGKNRKDSADLILEDNDSYIFVESKAKRMKMEALIDLVSENENSEIDQMCKFVMQVYKTVNHAMEGYYDRADILKFNKNKKVYISVVTLEDWFMFGEKYAKLTSKVESELHKIDLEHLYEQVNFIVMSASTFEHFIQVIQKSGISKILKEYFKSHKGNFFDNYLIDTRIPNEFIFKEENKRLFNMIIEEKIPISDIEPI